MPLPDNPFNIANESTPGLGGNPTWDEISGTNAYGSPDAAPGAPVGAPIQPLDPKSAERLKSMMENDKGDGSLVFGYGTEGQVVGSYKGQPVWIGPGDGFMDYMSQAMGSSFNAKDLDQQLKQPGGLKKSPTTGTYGGGGGATKAPGTTATGTGGGSAPSSTGVGGGGGQETSQPYSNPPPIGGAGETSLDPNREVGVNDPGAQPVSLGDYFGGSRGGLGGGTSIFDRLPENPTIKDILGAVQRGQEGTRDAQLDIYSGLFNESMNSPESMGQRDLINRVLQNPESMDEATINRIMGQQNQAIGSRASQLSQLAGDRAASMGVGRDMGQREQGRILREGAAAQSEAERATRIDAAKTNFGDRLNVLQGAGGAIQQDQGARRGLGAAAAGVHGASQDRGDVFLTNALLTSPDTPKIAGANAVRFNDPKNAYGYN
jgi:hypothetical protein